MAARRLLMLLVLALLAACASRPPAPVESRTRPPGAAVPAPRPPPTPAAPAGAPPGTAPGDGVVVQSAQVRPSGIEVRPLGGATPAPAAGGVRTQPKGVKRPYTPSALAELKAAEGAVAGAGPSTGAGASGGAAPGAASAGALPAAAATVPPGAPAPSPAATPPATTPPTPTPPVATTAPAPGGPPAPASGVSSGDAPAGKVNFAWPAKGRVIAGFSEPRSMGLSIAGTPGDPVAAAADGRVIFSGPGPRGYGNLIIVKHDAETLSVYAHNRALLVKEGQAVKQGQTIAELGDTGTDRPRLHFEIRRNGRPVDPLKLLPPR
jgi:lipoprotein NlpD